ncbi:MAG: YerC/YecD family TrpR-related protein [Candidatus Gracilibacteria bacterium]
MESELKTSDTRELWQAISSLKTEQEVKNFFRDLCTLAELKAMTERWQVAKQVKLGIPYRNISKKTGASTATITRVAHWLHHGMGGYKLVLNRS